MATYAIGDIQGCLPQLKCLLQKISFDPDQDTLWLAGDLINRGSDCLGTLRFLYSLRNNIVCVLGNHDLHLLAVAYGQRKINRGDTLADIIAADDREPILHWLRQQPLVHHDSKLGFTMVHAGIPPIWSVEQSLKKSREVELFLQSDNFKFFLKNMYGNTPNRWDENLKGIDRLRVITNYFTRMRFCNSDSELELTTKNSKAPIGYQSWFTIENRAASNDKIIFGHWAALKGCTGTDNTYAIDTGCVWGGKLSALRLEDKTLFSCDCPQ
jgi:bis(5'-nucleosyl)-tetraphosphatase (symmetrical)